MGPEGGWAACAAGAAHRRNRVAGPAPRGLKVDDRHTKEKLP